MARGMCGECGEEVDFDTHDRDTCRDNTPPTLEERRAELAEQLIEDDAVDVFDDSNSGGAAALAAADLIAGWESYDEPFKQANAHLYQPGDVDEVIRFLQAWKAKGCPAPKEDA